MQDLVDRYLKKSEELLWVRSDQEGSWVRGNGTEKMDGETTSTWSILPGHRRPAIGKDPRRCCYLMLGKLGKASTHTKSTGNAKTAVVDSEGT